MRRISAAAAIGIAALSLTACGGSPDDASEKDFCKAYDAMNEYTGDDFDKGMDLFDELKDTGTPESIDGDAREGFEILVDTIDGKDDEDEIEDAFDDLDKDDEKKVTAFYTEAEKTCSE